MKLAWMGEYRELVEKLIRYCNRYAAVYKEEKDHGLAVPFSYAQIQVVEYLLENEELNQNMSTIASRLGINLSTFSKLVNKLTGKGLLEKYYLEGNRKNIVIRVSPMGRELYEAYSIKILEQHFAPMFGALEGMPKDCVKQLAQALDNPFAEKNELPKTQPVLIPCDKNKDKA